LRELLNYNEIFLKLYYEVLSSVFTVVIIMKNKTEKRPFSKYPSSLTDNRAFYNTANPKIYKNIKGIRDNLKCNPTKAESVIWAYLRNKRTGYKIRRQHIVGNYISDFICLSKNLIIEIDGKIHLKQKETDLLRTEKLNDLGFEIIRFSNEDVLNDPKNVALQIKDKLDSLS